MASGSSKLRDTATLPGYLNQVYSEGRKERKLKTAAEQQEAELLLPGTSVPKVGEVCLVTLLLQFPLPSEAPASKPSAQERGGSPAHGPSGRLGELLVHQVPSPLVPPAVAKVVQ